MKKKTGAFFLISIIALVVGFLSFRTTTQAGPIDGGHWFSLDGFGTDTVYYTPEDGTFGSDYTISGLGGQDIDALSSEAHPPVNLVDMYTGEVDMVFSKHAPGGDLFEWTVTGPPILPGPRTIASTIIHDINADLGFGTSTANIDALESDAHDPTETLPSHGPPHYFSVEGTGALDEGDVFLDIGAPSLYLDDGIFAPVIGFDPGLEQLDALIVFDVIGTETAVSAGPSLFDSDAIFFSLAPGTFDPVGDNVYWYSAFGGGMGGLYLDPGFAGFGSESAGNVDALDVHDVEIIPEPGGIILLGIGLALFAGAAIKRKLKKAKQQ